MKVEKFDTKDTILLDYICAEIKYSKDKSFINDMQRAVDSIDVERAIELATCVGDMCDGEPLPLNSSESAQFESFYSRITDYICEANKKIDEQEKRLNDFKNQVDKIRAINDTLVASVKKYYSGK